MGEVAKSTRLRFILAEEPADLTAAIDSLPFKVEIKSISESRLGWICYFVIPDNVLNFNNVDLRE